MLVVDPNTELVNYYDLTGQKTTITINKYNNLLSVQDRDALAEFVYQRLFSRYLKPFMYPDRKYKKEYKNGFSIMANACLLIETIQSFKNGWGDSNGRSKQAFQEFFESETAFHPVRQHAAAFYTNIRCGILHQGEISGGWKLTRSVGAFLDVPSRTINTIKFSSEIHISLKLYRDNLKVEPWDGPLWDNFRIKMRKIILNCAK